MRRLASADFSRDNKETMRLNSGFTLVELIVTMIVIGIMAVTVIPRMNVLGSFDARGYGDQIASWLRYAQKSALAQRRMVSVDLSTSPPTLRQAASATCNTSGSSMSGLPGWRAPGPSTTVTTNTLGNTICFDTLGRPYATALLTATQSIVVSDGDGPVRTIFVEPETGYIHD